jgi:two-component system sensor histidine kinase UhpB
VDTGLYVCVGIPTSDALASANAILFKNVMGLAVVCVLVFGAAWFGGNLFVLKGVNALLDTTERLGSGDMTSRMGPVYPGGELGRLARTFDDMAEALEARTMLLHQAEAKYRSLVEQLPAITYTASPGMPREFLYVSPQVETILGFSPWEWTGNGDRWLAQIHPDDRARVIDALGRIDSESAAGVNIQYRMFSRDGRLLWFSDDSAIVAGESDQCRHLQGIVTDITHRKEAEEALIEYQGQLRSMASELTWAEEKERRRIATELHDRVGQALAMAKIKLGALHEKVASAGVVGAVEEVRDLVEEAIRDTRSLLFQISSPILYELGFEAALEWLVEQTEGQHGIAAEFEDDEEPKPLDEDVRVLLFRAAGELVTNVVKHSRAAHVKVAVRRDGPSIRVEVRDDGCGFDASQISSRWGRAEGFGLFSIRERLKHVNGMLDVTSRPGRGTSVIMLAPLQFLRGADGR